MAQSTILVVEDSRVHAKQLKGILNKLDYSIQGICSTGEEAIKRVGEGKPDLVLMDIVLKGEIDGIDAAHQITSDHNVPVVYLSAYSEEEMIKKARITEPHGYILKPFNEREIYATIEMGLYKKKMDDYLQKAYEKLKNQVKERVAELEKTNQELQEKIEELEKWQRLSVGRELKMSELKTEIKELKELIQSM
jgi:CheY-like chemotaxis protein